MKRSVCLHCLQTLSGLLLLLIANLQPVAGAELQGRVTDSESGASLSGARITLDPDPAVPDDESVAVTGPWGFYSLTDLSAGTYALTASYPGYVPQTVERTLAETDFLMEDFALEPLVSGQTLITVYGHVVDTKSSLELSGVPVRIRRFNSENATDPFETFVKVTDDLGMVEFKGLPTGWYDFRFNATENDTARERPFWESMSIGRRLLTTSYAANARLMPIGQDVTFKVEGLDPKMPGQGGGLEGVYVTLTGIRPDFVLPEGFDPSSDLLSNYVVPILPPRNGVTNKDGEVDFKNLPAIPFMVQVQKYGYKRAEEPYFPDDESGEFETPKMLFLDLAPTRIMVGVESFYEDVLMPDGVPVVLQGLDGTHTEGIFREAPAFLVPFGSPFPFPSATFEELLPGRYRISVDHDKASPVVSAADFAGTTYTIGFKGEMLLDVPVAETIVEILDLEVIPATIRGKLWVADESGTLEIGASAIGEESPEYLGPIYKPMEQPGIEFTETVLADHLPPEIKVLAVDADEDGNFIATVFPGVYSVSIPPMDGYWGSNYELVNAVDGEQFSLGWPYNPPDIFFPIPAPPFGSLGMIINSRGDYELNLYVRKQLWYVSGEVSADIVDHPALRRIVTNATEPPVTTFFSDLGVGGMMTLELEGGGSVDKPLVPKVSGSPGEERLPATSAVFDFTVGPGLHSLSGGHPNHEIINPDSSATEFDIPIPNLEHPGVLVEDYIVPLTEVWGGLPGLPDALKGEYSGTTGLSIKLFGTNDQDERIEVASFAKPDIFTFPGHGTTQFAVGAEPFKMVPGSYSVWKMYDGKWYSLGFDVSEFDIIKEIEFDIVEGPGPGSPPPALTYTLTVEAVSDADPTHKIPGLMVKFDEDHTFETPATVSSHDGNYVPDSVSPTNKWIPAVGSGSTITSYDVKFDLSTSAPKIDVTLRMKRGMGVKGKVLAKLDPGDDGEAARAMERVRVMIRNRYGNPLASVVTNEMGEFELETALNNAQTIFLEVDTPGFYPFRKRITPNNLGVDDTPVDIDETLSLKPLPGPLMVTGTFDRFGPYLPGVSKSSSGGVLEPDEDINMSYELRATENELSISLVPFDSPSGEAGEAAEVIVKDTIKEIWLVDPRGFPRDPFAEDPVMLPPPESDALFNLKMRRYLDAAVRRTFMEPVGPGMLPTQWHRRFNAAKDEETGESVAMGEVSLASLPAGDFLPLVVAVSTRGAYSVKKIEFFSDETHKNLVGLRLPPWAATVADVLGTAAAVKEAGSAVNWDNFIPEGYLKPLPDITADIEVSEAGFMKYSYEIGMNLQEGMALPGTGIGTVIPGFAGLDVAGSLNLEINGEARTTSGFNAGEISLGGEIVATSNAIDIGDYIPRALPKSIRKNAEQFIRNNVDAKVVAGGSAELSTTETFIKDQPLERNIKATTSAGVSIPISIDITPLVQTIPTVGPVVTTLRRTRFKPTFKANIDDGIGTSVTRTFTTQYPHIVKEGSGGSVSVFTPKDPTNHTERRHFLGGEIMPFSKKYNLERALCMRFGVGLEVEIGNERAGASGMLSLTGNECKIPTAVGGGTQPGLKITLNRFGDWPPITRVQGKMVGEIEAYLDAWIARFSKSWSFDLIEIDIPFNSEASFSLSPIGVTETVFGLNSAAAAEYLGEPPTLVQDLFLPGQIAVDGTGDALMLFTDVDPASGEVLLQFAHRTGTHEWGAIGELARAGGVVQADVLALPGGAWMAVWTEIGVADTGSLTPPSNLMFATSADGSTWTAPASLAALSGVASEFRLVPMADDEVGLVFLETERGPHSNVFSVNAVLFDGSEWGDVMELLPPAIVHDWDAAGPGATGSGDVQIGLVTDGGKLGVLSWDGSIVGDPMELVSGGIIPPVDLGNGPDDFFTLVYAIEGAGIGLFTKTAGEDWVDRGIIFEGALPGSLTVLDLLDGSEYAYLLAWNESGSGSVYYGYVDNQGSILADAANLTQNDAGRYGPLIASRRGDSHDASLFTLFQQEEVTEIRTFDVSRLSGSINNDRDGDLMDDLSEMRIVDADTEDAIETIDDVLEGDDFDMDGFSNKAELDAGTDPTHPGSFPGQVVALSTEVADCFEFGTVPGQVAIVRSGDGQSEITVKYDVTGTASAGIDYNRLSGEATMPPGIFVHFLNIVPERDALAEGDETVVITLLDDPSYTAGEGEAVVTIKDLPMDAWRLANFSEAELSNELVTGDTSDADANGLILVLEYAFGISPNSHEYRNVPVSVVLEHPSTHNLHAGLIYLRPTDTLDLDFYIEVTDDLGNWLGGEESVDLVSVTDNGDGTETVVVRDKTSLAQGGRFLRLTVNRSTE